MCGIVGITGTQAASQEAFLSLTALQHRGQDAAGILSFDSAGFHCVKNSGLVETVFNRENMSYLTGNIAIGHSRYSTAGRGEITDVQPFLLSYPFGIGMVHNGNIVNSTELTEELKTKYRRRLLTQSDTEIILNVFAEGLSKSSQNSTQSQFEHLCEAVQSLYQKAVGSFSIVSLIADYGLIGFRDPNGIRPLVWGRKIPHEQSGDKDNAPADTPSSDTTQNKYIFASESVVLSFLGYDLMGDIAPGEIVFVDFKGNVQRKVLNLRGHNHCMFEWVYFASPESVIDEIPVYAARIQLGKNLASTFQARMAQEKLEPDVVVPVPETSRIAAIALAEELKLPFRELLIKNRYIKRTFILDSQEKRQSAVNLKLSPVRSEIQGKKIILVDDSIVRGTTSKKIIELMRQAGAAKIYFVSTCPPIRHPCFYGIDFPIQSELIASNRNLSEIERELGADAVIYQEINGLSKALALLNPSKDFKPCMACLDGNYPTDTNSSNAMIKKRDSDRKNTMKSSRLRGLQSHEVATELAPPIQTEELF